MDYASGRTNSVVKTKQPHPINLFNSAIKQYMAHAHIQLLSLVRKLISKATLVLGYFPPSAGPGLKLAGFVMLDMGLRLQVNSARGC